MERDYRARLVDDLEGSEQTEPNADDESSVEEDWVAREGYVRRFCRHIVAFLVCASLLLAVGVGLLHLWLTMLRSYQVCHGSLCERAALKVKSTWDPSLDSCTDPYGFACQGLDVTLGPEESSWTGGFTPTNKYIDDTLQKILGSGIGEEEDAWHEIPRAMYKACLDEDGTSTFVEMVLAQYPSLGSVDAKYTKLENMKGEKEKNMKEEKEGTMKEEKNMEEGENITGGMDVTHRRLSENDVPDIVASFFAGGMPVGFLLLPSKSLLHTEEAKVVAASLGSAGLTLPYGAYDSEETIGVYKEYVKRGLGLWSDIFNDPQPVESRAQNVVDFELKIRETLYLSPEDERDMTKLMHYSWEDMKSMNGAPFLRFMQSIQKLGVPIAEVVGTSGVETMLPSIPGDALQLFSENPDTFKDYLRIQLIRGYEVLLNSDFQENEASLLAALSGRLNVPRAKICVDLANGAFPWIVGRMFLNETDAKRRADIADTIIHYLKVTLDDNIRNNNWMDEPTKSGALDKLWSIEPRMGYPEALLSGHAKMFEDFYGRRELYTGLSGVELLDVAMRRAVVRDVGCVMDEWAMTPQTVNAAYDPSDNTITFPLAILLEPMIWTWPQGESFTAEYDIALAMTMGAFGAVVGHEITHGFDDQGSLFDKYGRMRNWWTKESKINFEDRATCFQNQYSEYIQDVHLPTGDVHTHLSGLLTRGENIADNGGLTVAYQTFKSILGEHRVTSSLSRLPGLTEMDLTRVFIQSFSMIWCEFMKPEARVQSLAINPHSPGRFRVIGTLHNFEAQRRRCDQNGPHCSIW